MPVKRWAPAASVLALCLGLVLIFGLRPAARPAVLPPAVAATPTSSPPLSQTPAGPSERPAATPTPTPTPTPALPAGYRIKIPRLAIDLPLEEGDLARDAVRQETPENVALHLPGTALPGDRGNSYIYAHARRGMFLSLWSAREGDEVVITAPDGHELRYVVSEVHPRVDPSDVSWVAATPTERLTLQTSTGPSPGDPRFVVVALPA